MIGYKYAWVEIWYNLALISPPCLNLLLDRVYLRLVMTDFIIIIIKIFLDYFYVLPVNRGNTYVQLNATHGEFYFCIFCTE